MKCAMSVAVTNTVIAVIILPKLKQTPAPAERTRVTKSSGKNNGNHPKKIPLKNPNTAFITRNVVASVGVVNQNMTCALPRQIKLLMK